MDRNVSFLPQGSPVRLFQPRATGLLSVCTSTVAFSAGVYCTEGLQKPTDGVGQTLALSSRGTATRKQNLLLSLLLLGLSFARNLKRVFLLVDARWGLKASDICLLSFFERHRIPFQLVLTKADLPEQKSLIKILQIVCLCDPPYPEFTVPAIAFKSPTHTLAGQP